jgi:predicted transcriptional regulator
MKELDDLRIYLLLSTGFKPEFIGIKESLESCLVLNAIDGLTKDGVIIDNIEKIGTGIKALGIEEKISISLLREIVKELKEKDLIKVENQGYILTERGREKRKKGDKILKKWINTATEALTEAKIESISEEDVKEKIEQYIKEVIIATEEKIIERKADIKHFLSKYPPLTFDIQSLDDEAHTAFIKKMDEIGGEIKDIVIPSSIIYCLARTYGLDQFRKVLEALSKCVIYLDTNVLIRLFCHAQPLYEFVNESVKLLNEIGVTIKYTNRTQFELEIHLETARRQIGDLQHVLPEMMAGILQTKRISPITNAFFRERKYKNWRHYKRRWDEEVEKKSKKYGVIKEDKNREDRFSNEHSGEISALASDLLKIFEYSYSKAEHDAYLIKYLSTKRKEEEKKKETIPIPESWIWSFDSRYPLIEMMEQEALVFWGRELNLFIGMSEPKLHAIEPLNALKTGVSFDDVIKSDDILVSIGDFPTTPNLQETYEKIREDFKETMMKEKIEKSEELKRALINRLKEEGTDKDIVKGVGARINELIKKAKSQSKRG